MTSLTAAVAGGVRRWVTDVTVRAAEAWRAVALDVRAVMVPWIATRAAVAALLVAAGLLGHLPGLSVPAAWPGAPAWMNAFLRYDAASYLSIAAEGYHVTNVVFFPAYPLLIGLLAPLLTGPLAALLWSHGAFLAGLAACHRLVRSERGAEAARATTWALCLWPTTLFFSAAYTESLFLCVASFALLSARRQRWLGAGLWAGLACLTRVNGVALLAAVVVAVVAHHAALPRRSGAIRGLLGALAALLPGCLLASSFPAWQLLAFGNGTLFLSQQSRWSRSFELPTTAIAREISHVMSDPALLRWVVYGPTLAALLALALLAADARRWRTPLSFYGAAVLMMAIVNPVHLASRHPLVSLDRYVLLAFPALGSLALALPAGWPRRAAAILSGSWAGVATLLFGLGAFIE